MRLGSSFVPVPTSMITHRHHGGSIGPGTPAAAEVARAALNFSWRFISNAINGLAWPAKSRNGNNRPCRGKEPSAGSVVGGEGSWCHHHGDEPSLQAWQPTMSPPSWRVLVIVTRWLHHCLWSGCCRIYRISTSRRGRCRFVGVSVLLIPLTGLLWNGVRHSHTDDDRLYDSSSWLNVREQQSQPPPLESTQKNESSSSSSAVSTCHGEVRQQLVQAVQQKWNCHSPQDCSAKLQTRVDNDNNNNKQQQQRQQQRQRLDQRLYCDAIRLARHRSQLPPPLPPPLPSTRTKEAHNPTKEYNHHNDHHNHDHHQHYYYYHYQDHPPPALVADVTLTGLPAMEWTPSLVTDWFQSHPNVITSNLPCSAPRDSSHHHDDRGDHFAFGLQSSLPQTRNGSTSSLVVVTVHSCPVDEILDRRFDWLSSHHPKRKRPDASGPESSLSSSSSSSSASSSSSSSSSPGATTAPKVIFVVCDPVDWLYTLWNTYPIPQFDQVDATTSWVVAHLHQQEASLVHQDDAKDRPNHNNNNNSNNNNSNPPPLSLPLYRSPQLFHEIIASGFRTTVGRTLWQTIRDRMIDYPRTMVQAFGASNVLFVRLEDCRNATTHPQKHRGNRMIRRWNHFTGLELDQHVATSDWSTFWVGPQQQEQQQQRRRRRRMMTIPPRTRRLGYIYLQEECKIWHHEFQVEYSACLTALDRKGTNRRLHGRR